jgi:hypothetical protein
LATRTLQANQGTRLDGEPVFVCQNLVDILRTPAAKVKPFVYKDLTMSLQSLPAPRFVRRTSLGPNEYRKNFRQMDREVIDAVTSREADRVTPLMSKIYLRLANAPEKYWEREGVLRFEADPGGEGRPATAWAQLCEVTGVASATASKALRWMHEQGVVGYFSGKNGVGIRIFLNRACSSIGVRKGSAAEKILAFSPASGGGSHASAGEAAFNDSYAVSEVLETDLNPRAPKNGAEQTGVVNEISNRSPTPVRRITAKAGAAVGAAPLAAIGLVTPVEEIMARLRGELEPLLQSAARQAAAREHERTREWLESRGLPKAARVAQREAYNVLRKYGVVGETTRACNAEVGRGGHAAPGPQPLTGDEVEELAQACVAMLEVKGQSVEVTLSGMGVEVGGFLLPEDAPRLRRKVQLLLGTKPE